MVTLQLETKCLDEGHARDLDIVGEASARTLDTEAHNTKVGDNSTGRHH